MHARKGLRNPSRFDLRDWIVLVIVIVVLCAGLRGLQKISAAYAEKDQKLSERIIR